MLDRVLLAVAIISTASPLSVRAASVRDLPTLLPPGPFHTAGSQIVDMAGRSVRLACIGLNQPNFQQSMEEQTRLMVREGFNCIRMSWRNATMTEDLAIIDRVIRAMSGTGLRLVLDNHTNEAGSPRDGWGAQQVNGLWYDAGGASDGTNGAGIPGTVTDAKFLSDWVAVARRYAGNDIVIGYDIRNEPLHYPGQCTWGDGNPATDIRAMYQRVGDAIQDVDPDKLIIAEGPQNWKQSFNGSGPAPEGDLTFVQAKPVVLHVPSKVVYSVHLYANFRPVGGPAAIARMNRVWGYLVTNDLAPVWIGETGASLDPRSTDFREEKFFYQTLASYLNGQDGNQHGPTFRAGQQAIGTTWWAWGNLDGQSPNGSLERDWITPRHEQQRIYRQFRQAPIGD